jgi:glutathione S-transferase
MTTAPTLLYDFPGSICSQMARLVLEEKGVVYERQSVDIMVAAEQFQPWYTALNPRAVVPTLRLGDEIVTDTITIVYRVDASFAGPSLKPADAAGEQAMDSLMREIMGLHYGVLLYSKRLEPDGTAPTVVARGEFLREQLKLYPERAEPLERRIAGNVKMQAILANPAEVERYVDEARTVVGSIDTALGPADFVSADHYTLADAFATAALARFRLHGFESWWSGDRHRNVALYYQRMRARASWDAAGVVDAGSERDL